MAGVVGSVVRGSGADEWVEVVGKLCELEVVSKLGVAVELKAAVLAVGLGLGSVGSGELVVLTLDVFGLVVDFMLCVGTIQGGRLPLRIVVVIVVVVLVVKVTALNWVTILASFCTGWQVGILRKKSRSDG